MDDDEKKKIEELIKAIKAEGLETESEPAKRALAKTIKVMRMVGSDEMQAAMSGVAGMAFMGAIFESPLSNRSRFAAIHALATDVLRRMLKDLKEHSKTCRAHAGDIVAFERCAVEVDEAFTRGGKAIFASVETKAAARGGVKCEVKDDEIKDDGKTGAPAAVGATGEPFGIPNITKEGAPDPELVIFDGLMRAAIQKFKEKKPTKAEREKIAKLISDYKGATPVLVGVKTMLEGKDTSAKSELLLNFIRYSSGASARE